jgi:hypothetical protein
LYPLLFPGPSTAQPAVSNSEEENEEEEQEGTGTNAPSPAKSTTAAAEDDEAAEDSSTTGDEHQQKDPEPVLAAEISFSKMTLTEAVSTLKLPVLIYEYSDEEGYSFVTADVLMLSGACKKDVHVAIDPTGTSVTVTHKIPESFLAWQRVAIEDMERSKTLASTKAAALTKASDLIRSKAKKNADDGRPVMEFKFKLPIACKTKFHGEPFISSYPNDYSDQRSKDNSNNYKVLHIDLRGLHDPREKLTKLREAKKPFISPLGKALDEETDEEDEEGDEYDDNPSMRYARRADVHSSTPMQQG